MSECRCAEPKPNDRDPLNRRSADYCRICQRQISREWTSNDKTLGWFLDGLAACIPARGEEWQRFRIHCEARELAGRPRFKHQFLNRDNVAEGLEEAADGALYAHLDVLKAKRAGEDGDVDMALIAAHHFYEAYAALLHLRQRRNGAP